MKAAAEEPQPLGVGVHRISLERYLADPCPAPSMRSGGVNLILPDTSAPAEFRALHPQLTEFPEYAVTKATKEMERGSVVHCLILGEGASVCVLNPADFPTADGNPAKTFGAKAAKAAKEEAEARGEIVMTPAEKTVADTIAELGRQRLASWFGAWPAGEIERTFVWQEESGYGPVWCMSRPDVWVSETATLGELKVPSGGLSDDALNRFLSADNGRTIIQAAWQRRGAARLFPELAGRIQHALMFLDPEPPYLGRRIFVSEAALTQADRRCDAAVRQFGWCLANDTWPEWPDGRLSGTSWLQTQWENAEEQGEL